tara:strand:+ start:20 stop:283 length:264 start_codon:yes stop_codon:yes gene_type:complete
VINKTEYRRRNYRDLCQTTEGLFLLFIDTSMIDNRIFHIYDKATNEPVKVCLTVDELEQMIAKREVDWSHWEVEPCYTDYCVEEASF